MPPPKDAPNILRVPGDYEVTSNVHNDTYPEIDPRQADLSGKSVFITGGSRGLGRAMAISFAKAGASQIAVGARTSLESLETDIHEAARSTQRAAPHFLPIKLDVTDPASVASAASEVANSFGRLDVLVNNAGILGKYGLIADSDPEEWQRVIDVNLRGPYLVTRAFLPLLLRSQPHDTNHQRWIINVTSGGAHLTNPTLSAYQVSKNALLKLSTLTNVEYAVKGIFTVAIHPGNCPTDIMGGPEAIPPHHKHVFVETPELSGDSIVYMIHHKADWLGGRYLNCTWDLPELLMMKDDIVAGDKLKTKFCF